MIFGHFFSMILQEWPYLQECPPPCWWRISNRGAFLTGIAMMVFPNLVPLLDQAEYNVVPISHDFFTGSKYLIFKYLCLKKGGALNK